MFNAKRIAKFLAYAVIAVTAATTTVAVSETASWAASCNGTTCSGKDPQAQGCAVNTDTPQSWTRTGGSTEWTIQIKHSATCSAAWGKLIHQDCSYSMNWYVSLERRQWTPYGYYEDSPQGNATSGHSSCNGGVEWTYMQTAFTNDQVRVCSASVLIGSPPPGRYDHLGNCNNWITL